MYLQMAADLLAIDPKGDKKHLHKDLVEFLSEADGSLRKLGGGLQSMESVFLSIQIWRLKEPDEVPYFERPET